MFNILLISHGNLAVEMARTAELITGTTEGVYTIGLQPEMGPEEFGDLLEEAAEKHGGQGLLVMADLYGGTPCNTVALRLLPKHENVEMLTGMNLAMVVEAISIREGTLKDAASELADIGREGIADMRIKLFEDAGLDEDDE